MPERKRPVKTKPTAPKKDVRDIQDPDHTVADFMRDLDKASTNESAEKLKRDRPGGASPKT